MLKIEFKVGNAAFRDPEGGIDCSSVADEIRVIADKVAEGFTAGPVTDFNGNTVGKWSLND